MAIDFACPSCQTILSVPDTAAGKRAKCSTCHAISTVPASTPTEIVSGPVVLFFCTSCGAAASGPVATKITCTQCGQRLLVPQPPTSRNKTVLGSFDEQATPQPPPMLAEEILPAAEKYCSDCGAGLRRRAEICPKCGCRQTSREPAKDSRDSERSERDANRIGTALVAIFLGAIGIHKFMMGYSTAGIVIILVGVLSCGVGLAITIPITTIEGIIYLTLTDDEFHRRYFVESRSMF